MLIIERKKVVIIGTTIIVALFAVVTYVFTNPAHRESASNFIGNFGLNQKKPKYNKGENVTVQTTPKEASKIKTDAAAGKKDNPIKKGKRVVIHHKDGSVETISKGATSIEPPKLKKGDPHIMAEHNGIWSVKRGNKTYRVSADKLHSLRDELKISKSKMYFPDETLFSYYIYAQEHHMSFKQAYQRLGSPNNDL